MSNLTTIKMKNHELYEVLQNEAKLNNLSGYPFTFELNRNIRKIKEIVSDIEALKAEIPEYTEFREKYIKLREKYADLDKNGKPVTERIDGSQGLMTYKVTEKIKEFEVEEKKLEKKYAKVLEEQQKKWADFNAALQDDVIITFSCVSEEKVPKTATYEQLKLIHFMICDKPQMKKV